ncbi:nucleotide sugar dehydrogenase [Myceligenerans salitolerans]|uniref:Nucleotide sugar dehydrogenase n=1 Tax=Myceligenerans salitolerans TaxID=1230528 RepID=A0ABS3IFP3_9MICO|nr:nucleotide sugar dehydrogenase [Myceligenerans salitolerans]MBO0611234.1 nucleotide sugar dehydrogenase [Myceligenerans salitolerans]
MSQDRTLPRVTVCGLGYVGLSVAVAAHDAGYAVTAYDVDEGVLARLKRGNPGISNVSPEQLVALTEDPATVMTNDLDQSPIGDVAVVCVPTPLTPGGAPDTSAIVDAARALGARIGPGTLVTLESTTWPGTTEELFAPLLAQSSGMDAGTGFNVAFSPERIDPGNHTHTFTTTPKVVGGLTARCTERAAAFYRSLGVPVVVAAGTREAEMSKLLENTYRFVNISFVNEFAAVCDAMDIDAMDAIRCASSKPFGFTPFTPSAGVGGHCIPVDPFYLTHKADEVGAATSMIAAADAVNRSVPEAIAEQVLDHLRSAGLLPGAKVLLCGVSYKPDVADLRMTPAIGVVRALRARGVEPSFIDPFVPEFVVDDVPVAPWSGGTADVAVVLQKHEGAPPPAELAHAVYDPTGARRPIRTPGLRRVP